MVDTFPYIHINYDELGRRRYARFWMTFTLIIADIVSLALAFGLVFYVLRLRQNNLPTFSAMYLDFLPALLIFIIFYALSGLYATVGVGPVDELRLLAKATNVAFLILMIYSFWMQTSSHLPIRLILLAWPTTLFLTQANRWLLRILARQIGFWGEPAVIVGTGAETQYIQAYLRDSIRLGIRPVAIVDGYCLPDGVLSNILKKTGIRTAILVIAEMSEEMKSQIIDHRRYPFHRLILIPSLDWVYSLGISTYDLEGLLGLGVRQNLLNIQEQWLKRGLDILVVLVGSLVVAPFCLIIALLIRLDSPGKVLYTQTRIGLDGKAFEIWKFRTMVINADRVLQDFLDINPDLKVEWEATHKLKNDPRITRVGKFLRKLSLDELPQVWNVLRGEMSLVGPRPIVDAEVAHYRHVFNLYKLVRPGITGLWQVSGRNDTGYEQRVRYDEYYIRNWSVWLDFYILLRTIWVVLTQRGAY